MIQARFEVAQGKPAAQSSTNAGGVASRAVDGNTNPIFTGGSITHTSTETNPWWRVDLGYSAFVANIGLWNRGDNGNELRLNGFTVLVGDTPDGDDGGPGSSPSCIADQPYPDLSVNLPCGLPGRYVWIQVLGTSKILSLAEVKVYTSDVRCLAAVT